jgi:hypothetical protein
VWQSLITNSLRTNNAALSSVAKQDLLPLVWLGDTLNMLEKSGQRNLALRCSH